MCVAPIEIAKAIPFVVTAVQPHGEKSARLQILLQRLDGSLAIWGVVQNPNAVNDVKTFRCKGQRKYIGLEGYEVAIGKILGSNLRGCAQVDPHYARSPAGSHLGKPSHAAAHIEDQLAFQFL